MQTVEDERKLTKEPIPDNFATLAEAAEFWDSHDFADYWDETQEVEFEVRIPRRRRVSLAAHIEDRVAEEARQEGVSIETLVNLWLAERLRIAV